jgi:hypothetical protein
MKIFDAHTHIFPEKIAEKATEGIGDFYNIAMQHAGTAEDLTKLLKNAGVCGCMCCAVATNPEQVGSINDFISSEAKKSNGFITGFCSLHPDMSETELDSEITRAEAIGLKGIKLHPDIQQFHADGKRACKIFGIIADRLPVLIHAGDSRYEFSSPKRIAKAMKQFGKLTIIAAHLGGWSEWDDAISELSGQFGERLYVDTSSSLYALTPEKATEYINAFGENHVLFGTDYPMWDIREELERFDRLDLSDEARSKILYQNAQKLLKL